MDAGKLRFHDFHASLKGESVWPPCRGEVWIGTEIFQAAELQDDLEGHFRLCHELEMDIVSLPLGDSPSSSETYRYLTPEDLKNIPEHTTFAIVAVIDGPFRTANLVERLEQ